MKKSIGVRSVTALALALTFVSLMASGTFATPTPNSAVVITRVFDDCPFSTLTTVNTYPSVISISDYDATCTRFANLHLWRFSEDGVNNALFNNGDAFFYSADMVLNGDGEAGFQVAPWWSESDGRFNIRSTDGEIACFGGRMPFFSFTGTFGLRYTKGDVIHLELTYLPNGLSESSPATVQYGLTYNGTSYASGPLKFDMGNPAEDPPHGLWGILNEARVGGYIQVLHAQGTGADVTYSNIVFAVPVAVMVDVKPGSCDNAVGVNANGLLSVAILGSADLDVSTIDASSVRLAGVAPKGSSIVDVTDATTSACEDCTSLPADAYPDLVLRFMTSGVVGAVTPATSEVVSLNLTGSLNDGTPIYGSDCATLHGNPKNAGGPHGDSPVITILSAPSAPIQVLSYGLPSESTVKLSVYSVNGRLIEQLVQGIETAGTHTVSWDASGRTSGVYFYRLETPSGVTTAKGLIVQ